MLVFRIAKQIDGTFLVDGISFATEAQAANMCIRMVQDLGSRYRIVYPD